MEFNLIGGKYHCDPSKNNYKEICLQTDSKSNTFNTIGACHNECDGKYINIQLKKANLYKESLQFYSFIRHLIEKENMKIYIKGGNVIGLKVLELICSKYSNDSETFSKVFQEFLKMELIKDWDFTAYTNHIPIDEKYREKLNQIAAKYKLVPRAKTFVLFQAKYPIQVYEKALFEIAVLDTDPNLYSKMEIPLTTMKVQINRYNLKYIFILATNFYMWTTKSKPIDLDVVKKVISQTNISIHPHKNGLYDPKGKIDTGDLNSNLIKFIEKFTDSNKYWTQFLITQLEDPYRLVYRMVDKNIKKTELINNFISKYIKGSNNYWLIDTKKAIYILDKFTEKLGLKLSDIYTQTQLLEPVLDFLDGSNWGKAQIQVEWNDLGPKVHKRILNVFNPFIKQIGKEKFKKMIQTLMETKSLTKLKPSEMTCKERIIKFFNFLIEKNIL
jgi:hypothetical protein